MSEIWMLLVGVNHYHDEGLPDLNYAAFDCQGLSEALNEVAHHFEHRERLIHHDGAKKPATLSNVRASLQQIKTEAKPEDTILFYFSGHGLLEPQNQQVVLCFQDTVRNHLLETGLALSELLKHLNESAPNVQFVWLDACHSGNITSHETSQQEPIGSPTPQLIQGLQQQAAQMQGFYALLSCDKDQRCWEFPEMEHGIFTYYLMRGLRGEAVDDQGQIKADDLYRYLYHQTLHYIDQTNQQLRLINQQKLSRGESQLYTEYSLQTPKRIVEGVGDFVLGSASYQTRKDHSRQAVVIEEEKYGSTPLELSKVLHCPGQFEIDYWQQGEIETAPIQQAIQSCLQSDKNHPNHRTNKTALLYLQGHIETTPTGDTWLVLANNVGLSRTWLRQQIQQARAARQILIFDCPGAGKELADWIEELKLQKSSQCIIMASSPLEQPDQFAQVVLETLTTNQQGVAVASWIYQLKGKLAETNIKPYFWLSINRGVIELIPVTHGQGNTTETDLGICPYQGLRAFDEGDHRYFFGREELTQTLLAQLNQHSFLAVVGASGSGKSSVINAGVLAELRKGSQIPGSDSWRICKFRPGDNPLQKLADNLIIPDQDGNVTQQQQKLQQVLEQGIEEWVHWLRMCPEPQVVIIIDQFEELFTLTPSGTREQFLHQLLSAVDHASDRVKVVISLRADFITACLDFPKLANWLQEFSVFVSSLTENDYRQVIVKPAERVGLQVEPELVEVLLKELSYTTGNLPLLEFVLEQLWQYRDEGTLTLKAYQDQIGGLEGVLERKANSVYYQLDEQAQACVQWIFLNLTHLGENLDTSRRVSKADLVVDKYPISLVDRTLQALTEANLVVVDDQGIPKNSNVDSQENNQISYASSDITIEVAHEILISNWSMLQHWLNENRRHLQLQRELQQAAKLWQEKNKNPDFLWQGVQLAEAEEVYNNYFNKLPPQVQEFIKEGLEQREKLRRRRKRYQRVLQTLTAACLALAAGSGILAWLTYKQNILSKARRLAAEARRLVPEGQSQGDSSSRADNDISALLAIKSYQVVNQSEISLVPLFQPNPPVEVNQALRSSLETIPYKNLMHSEPVRAVAYEPDGEQVITGSSDSIARIWNLDKQKVIAQLEGHQASIEAIAYSPKGERIVTGSSDGTARIWNSKTKQEIARFQHQESVEAVAYGLKGERIVTGSSDGTAHIWDVETQQEIARFDNGQPVKAVAYGPNGKRILTGSSDGTARVWNLKTQQEIARFEHQGSVEAVDYGPKGETILTGSIDNTARIWDIQQEKEITRFQHQESVKAVSYGLQGERVVTSSNNGIVRVWNANTETVIDRLDESQAVNDIAYNSGKNEILTASNNGTARVKKVQKGAEINQFQHNFAIRDVAYGPKGETAITTSSTYQNQQVGGIVKVWNTQNGEKINTRKYETLVTSMTYGPEGEQVLTGHENGTAQIWNRETEQIIANLEENKRINAVAYGAKAEEVVTAHVDGITRVWNPNTENVVARLEHKNNSSVNGVDYRPDGERVITGHSDGTAKIWNVNTEKVITSFDYSQPVNTVAYGPQGKKLIVGDNNGSVQIYSADSKQRIAEFNHDNAVRDIAYGPKGETVVTGSSDTTARVWDIPANKEIARITFYQRPVRAVAYEPNANKVLAGTNSGTANSHWVHSSQLKELLCQRVGRNFTATEWEKYLNASLQDYEIVCSQLSVHSTVLEKAMTLARQGQRDEGIALLKHIKKLEGDTDLYPATEKTETDPKTAIKKAIEHPNYIATPANSQPSRATADSNQTNVQQASVRTLQNVYTANEPIQVQFKNLPGNQTDWITIRRAEAPDDSYKEQYWKYTHGQQNGTMTFEPLPPGEYEVRLYFDWQNTGSYKVRDRHHFRVRGSTN